MLLLPAFNSIPLTIPVAGIPNTLWSVPMSIGILKEGQNLFVTYWDYAPTVLEWCVALLPVGIVCVMIVGAMSLYPELPEMKRKIAFVDGSNEVESI